MPTDYGYEYFCGANILLEIESMPILECAGLSYSLNESKRPLYGYSSRHFDAVSAGQVLISGTILINYVSHNYLFQAIKMGLSRNTAPTSPTLSAQSNELRDFLNNPDQTDAALQEFLQDPNNASLLPPALKEKHYDLFKVQPPEQLMLNPHDSYGGLDIKISFGNRAPENLYSGSTGYTINDVHFTGRCMQITVSEDAIVEEYPFFARNISQRAVPYRALYTPVYTVSGIETQTTIVKGDQ
jgi:hypothetical protein